MKLFFETEIQSLSFLMTLPLGFAMALLLDINRASAFFRCLADILTVLLAGFSLMLVVIWRGENALRLYHLLGLLAGAVLYVSGVGRLWRAARGKSRQKRKLRQDKCSCMQK